LDGVEAEIEEWLESRRGAFDVFRRFPEGRLYATYFFRCPSR
jgi:hypothetical protein